MYKINLEFISGVECVYTKEEEIATDSFWCDLKYRRMLDRWVNILCPYVSISDYCIWSDNQDRDRKINPWDGYKNEEIKKYETYIEFINKELEHSNKKYGENKSFTITITEF